MERRPFIKIGIVLLALILSGISGYILIENWSFIDAIYMVFITLTTVGYREVKELSINGKVFTIIFLLCGMGIFFYSVTIFARGLFEGELQRFFHKTRLIRRISRMQNHIIVCGFGRLGNVIAKELHAYGLEFIVIDKTQEVIPALEEGRFIYIIGDYTKENVLVNAGIKKAKAIIITGGSSSDNVFVTLTARELNPRIKIIAHCEDENLSSKIIKAGADSVFSPYSIGGKKVVQNLIQPNVVDFIDIVTRKGSMELQMEEIVIPEGSPYSEKVLKEAGLREKFNISIIGIIRESGEILYHPAAEIPIKEKDILLCLGRKDDLERFTKSLGGVT